MTDIFLSVISFFIYAVIQALAINGIHYCFQGKCLRDATTEICDGNVFFKIAPKFFDRNKHKMWSKPLYSCIKCMSSFYSLIFFLPLVIYLFGFYWVELYFLVINIFTVSTLNWLIYQKL